MQFKHIGLPVKDIKAAERFYDAIASSVHLEKIDTHDDFVGYGEDGSYEFYLHTGRDAVCGLHICFGVVTKEEVDAFHRAAVEAGAKDNGAPGIRADYAENYYAAFVIDPDGNNIEAVCLT